MASEKEVKSKKETKNKKSFFKDFKAELKKVIWPTPKQLFNNTVAVITIVIITAVIVFVLDFLFDFLNKYGIDNLKSRTSNTNSVQNIIQIENNVSSNIVSSENSIVEE